ncbi:MAG: hypothetical protein K2Q33_05050 [Gammaproteobacteria bacterium]|nr:hypothetical protein [Gammaproteobacteria bacterium]
MKTLWEKQPRLRKRKILAAFTLVFIAIFAFLTNKVWSFSSFVNILAPMITVFLWSIYIAIAYYCLYEFLKEDEDKPSLIEDKEQAEKFCYILKNKCEGKKALMITGPWGLGKTCFYNASLNPALKKAFPYRRIVEVSCFGMSSSGGLIAQILNKQFFLEHFTVFFNKIGQVLSGTPYFKRSLIPSGLIIIADDFERFSGDYIEVLGFFDYLIREKNCQIIILCNEEKINKEETSYQRQYQDFSEKIIEKHPFKVSREQMLVIIKSESFTLNGEEYSFNEIVRDHFLKLVDITKNFRIAQGAWVDLREISKQLVHRLEEISDVDISKEKKEEGLKSYFEHNSFAVIKAVFIKNAHKEEAYFQHQEEYKKHLRSGSTKNFSIKDEYLSKISSIRLSEFDYCAGAVLTLPASMKLYLKEGHLYDAEFVNEIVVDFILVPDIFEKLDDCSDGKIKQNQDAIRRSFFNYFEFIKSVLELERPCFNFIVYKVILLKFSIKLSEKENGLMGELEEKFTKEKIATQINNLLHNQNQLEIPRALRGIDPNREFLKQLEEQYPIGPEMEE